MKRDKDKGDQEIRILPIAIERKLWENSLNKR